LNIIKINVCYVISDAIPREHSAEMVQPCRTDGGGRVTEKRVTLVIIRKGGKNRKRENICEAHTSSMVVEWGLQYGDWEKYSRGN
jgi:hypothetical protein